jgi:hypothetical protein
MFQNRNNKNIFLIKNFKTWARRTVNKLTGEKPGKTLWIFGGFDLDLIYYHLFT